MKVRLLFGGRFDLLALAGLLVGSARCCMGGRRHE
jgi:hypothetical protein